MITNPLTCIQKYGMTSFHLKITETEKTHYFLQFVFYGRHSK